MSILWKLNEAFKIKSGPKYHRLKTQDLKLKTPMPYQSFENLDVWKKACRLSVEMFLLLKECREYGLKDQMTRAAVSIASNIAEGAERRSDKEFIRFLHIAKGSATELRTQLYIAAQIGLIGQDDRMKEIEELTEISKMLHGLIKSLSPAPQI